MEEIDKSFQVFMPKEAILPTTTTEASFGVDFGNALRTFLVYLSHLRQIDEKTKVGKDSRLRIITLWSDLFTTGKKPLYNQLFLRPSILKSDTIFDHPLGKYLCYFNSTSGHFEPFWWNPTQPESLRAGNVSLGNHILAIEGALNLTADDIGRILDDRKRSS